MSDLRSAWPKELLCVAHRGKAMPGLPIQLKALRRLSVFVQDVEARAPFSRLPVYAEVVWTHRPQPETDGRFSPFIPRAVERVDEDLGGDEVLIQRLQMAITLASPQVWGQAVRDELLEEVELLVRMLKQAVEQLVSDDGRLREQDEEALTEALGEQLRSISERHNLEVRPEVPALEPVATAYPLGMLATDHVGYLSFDLARLPPEVLMAIQRAKDSSLVTPPGDDDALIWIYPLLPKVEPIDALKQARFTKHAVLARISLPREPIPSIVRHLGLPAMQDPDLSDWEVSPGSFATNPGTLVGEDGCESVLPANLAVQEYLFHQLVQLTDLPLEPGLNPGPDYFVRLGLSYTYRLRWFSLGHSLGQVLYSCPLAPGESVNLAVIDWVRTDAVKRDEATKLNEQLVHTQRRDRTISETVEAALTEVQRGSSFMGGLAGAVGASIPIKMVNLSAGAAHSLGGATATSKGSRTLNASTMQRLNDNISQASSAVRELHSTVVVESSQAEKESVETRTIVNYNHSHALTILYYEVLRHFRIVADLVQTRPVVLIEELPVDFSVDDNLIEHRLLLENGLLDERLKACFDAIDRLICLRAAARSQAKLNQRNLTFSAFTVELLTGKFAEGGSSVKFFLVLKAGGETKLVRPNVQGGDPAEHKGNPFTGDKGEYASSMLVPEGGPIAYSSIKALKINFVGWDKLAQDRGFPDPADWTLGALRLKGTSTRGEHVLFDSLLNRGFLCPPGQEGNSVQAINVEIDIASPEPLLFDDPAATVTHLDLPEPERCCFERLQAHLVGNKAYYNRLLKLNEDPDSRAIRLLGIPASGNRSLLDVVENRTLATLGKFVAYPIVDKALSERILKEIGDGESPVHQKLVTLPTRGVFAEAKLGHCNASEQIDNTRFWDWQQSPIPHHAPEIAPIQTVVPTFQQSEGTAPTAFPNSLLNIVNPPTAPDPHGLSAALTAIATANIFRDMSGKAEVADLLKKLTDASVQIAGTAKPPPAPTTPAQGGSGGGSAPQVTPKPELTTPPATKTPEQRESDRIDNIRKAGQTARDFLPPSKQGPVQDKIAADLVNVHDWRFVVKGNWIGAGFVMQAMEATFDGHASFTDMTDDTVPFIPSRTNSAAIFHARHQGVPAAVTIRATAPKSPGGGFAVHVPPLEVDGRKLTERSYDIPVRTNVSAIDVVMQDTIVGPKADPKYPVLYFEVVGKLNRKEIKVTSEITLAGELAGDFQKAFTREATLEVLKLAIASTLKAAVKVNVGGKTGIEGTYEIVFYEGFEVKQVLRT